MFVDSMSPLDRPWLGVASMGDSVLADLLPERDEGAAAAARGPCQPPVLCFLACLAPDHEDVPQALHEQVGAVQPWVGLGKSRPACWPAAR